MPLKLQHYLALVFKSQLRLLLDLSVVGLLWKYHKNRCIFFDDMEFVEFGHKSTYLSSIDLLFFSVMSKMRLEYYNIRIACIVN
jgi:hypothetical protein